MVELMPLNFAIKLLYFRKLHINIPKILLESEIFKILDKNLDTKWCANDR